MLFMHYIADFNLQGDFKKLKVESEWGEYNEKTNGLYKYDYIYALLAHSFVWTCCIMAVWFFKFDQNGWFALLFVLNIVDHALTDELKANCESISLWTDQMSHIGMIFFTYVIMINLGV